jgi:hypothetical protein
LRDIPQYIRRYPISWTCVRSVGIGLGRRMTAEARERGEVGSEGTEGVFNVFDGRDGNSVATFSLPRIRTRGMCLRQQGGTRGDVVSDVEGKVKVPEGPALSGGGRREPVLPEVVTPPDGIRKGFKLQVSSPISVIRIRSSCLPTSLCRFSVHSLGRVEDGGQRGDNIPAHGGVGSVGGRSLDHVGFAEDIRTRGTSGKAVTWSTLQST